MSAALLNLRAVRVSSFDRGAFRASVLAAEYVATEHGIARVLAIGGEDDRGNELVRVAFCEPEKARAHVPNPNDAFLRLRDVRPMERL